MGIFQDAVDITRQESRRTTWSANRWEALDQKFDHLLRVAPPLQHHRVKALGEFAKRHDMIEEAEWVLSVAQEIVSLQQRLDARNDDWDAA